MPYSLNPKIRNLKPYGPLSGEFRIRLDANESFLQMPETIKEDINKAVSNVSFNRYPDPLCTELCAAFASYYGIDKSLVTAGDGSDELISIIMNAFTMKGDTVLTIEPDFSMYRFYASLSEVNCITLQKSEDLTISVDDIIAACNEHNVRIVMFSNPCNPTSLGICKKEVVRLISSVNALVVLDEAYMDFWNQSLLSEADKFDNLIILRTSSKAVGSAAIRLGFAVANSKITNALRAVKSPYNVNSLTQRIGTCIFSHNQELQDALKQILLSRDSLYDEIKKIESDFPCVFSVYPTCTNFVFIKPFKCGQAKDIFDYFIKNGVAIRFMGDYLRITAGSSWENQEVIKLLRAYFAVNQKTR